MIEARRKPTSRVQLIVCTRRLQANDPLIASPIVLPPLAERTAELDRIIDGFAIDAGGPPDEPLTPVDREWVHQHEARTLPGIEKATRRLVAIRDCDGSITHAASRLGMAHGALSEWVSRRSFRLDVDDEDSES